MPPKKVPSPKANAARAVLVDPVVGQFEHLVLLVAQYEFRLPVEILLHDVAGGQFQFIAPKADFAEVGPELREARRVGQLLLVEQVARAFVEEIGAYVDAVLEQAGFDTDVELVRGLPLQSFVGHLRGLDAGVPVVHVAGAIGTVGVVDTYRGIVSGRTVAGAQFEEIQPPDVVEPRLLRSAPSRPKCPGRSPSGRLWRISTIRLRGRWPSADTCLCNRS